MEKRKGSIVPVAVIMVLGCVALGYLRRPRETQSPADLARDVPATIGAWVSEGDVPARDLVVDILQTDAILTRVYGRSDEGKIVFSVIYAVGNREAFHPPEYCIIGGGADLVDRGTEEVLIPQLDDLTLETNRMLFDTTQGKHLVLNWYVAEGIMTASYQKQQWRIVLAGIKGGTGRGAMLRVTVPLLDRDVENCLDMATQFIQEVLPKLPAYLMP